MIPFTEVEDKTKFDISVKNDSAFYHIHYSDKLFLFSRGDILRKFKGHYFLNRERFQNYWSVMKLGVTKNGIVIGTISSEEDINNLKDLTSTKSDSVYSFKPTKKQLKKFLKENGFQNEERFVRIEENTFK